MPEKDSRFEGLLFEDADIKPDAPSLTARQLEVMRCIVSGKTESEEVAQTLGIKTSTVGNHLEHIYRSLGVKNKTQAVLAVLRMGLIDFPGNNQRDENR